MDRRPGGETEIAGGRLVVWRLRISRIAGLSGRRFGRLGGGIPGIGGIGFPDASISGIPGIAIVTGWFHASSQCRMNFISSDCESEILLPSSHTAGLVVCDGIRAVISTAWEWCRSCPQ
jgi:hypothetical protein